MPGQIYKEPHPSDSGGAKGMMGGPHGMMSPDADEDDL
jgi:hypothetical protein